MMARPENKLPQEVANSESRPRTTPREESKKKGGYECEFVEQPPLQSECSICLLVLREPHLISCCGHSFCKTCIGCIQRDGKPCPLCNKPGFTTVDNGGLRRSLSEFQVRCSHCELGCEWVDVLGKLDQHLNADPQLEGCPFTSIECIHCKDHMRRHLIAGHQNERCPKRPFTCEYCEEYESTFEDVVNHWAECKCYLRILPCPNNCHPSGSGIKHQNQKYHMNPLTVVECDFHYAGCGVKLRRKDMAGHIKEESVTHISLLAAENRRLARRLLEREKMPQLTQVQQKRKTTRAVMGAVFLIAAFAWVLRENHRQYQDLVDRVTQREEIAPVVVKMCGFAEFKSNETSWYSRPFYTHLPGYRMCLIVHANGRGSSQGTHVSVYTNLMRGEFDSHLDWPFQGNITVQALSHEDENNHDIVYTISYTKTRDDDIAGRVTLRELALNGFGFTEFISHSRSVLGKYLKNDCLTFKILT